MTRAYVIGNQRKARSLARSGGFLTRQILLYTIITAIAFIYILPVLGVILTSTKLNSEIAQAGLWTFPKTIHLDNYIEIWTARISRRT